MVTDVKLYDCQCAIDYYELDENGEQNPKACSNLVYTNDVYYAVEWYDKDVCISAQEQQFSKLEDALKFYKEMKAKENK